MRHVAMVARWKPVHLGHAAVLRGLMRNAERVSIGIGSSNIIDARNPFSAAESAEMLARVVGVSTNVTIFEVPDLGDGPRWRDWLVERLGDVDLFVTANPCVASLMRVVMPVAHPVHFVPEAERIALNATMVRQRMLAGEPWDHLVPPAVAAYLRERCLVERFVKAFAAQPAAVSAGGDRVE